VYTFSLICLHIIKFEVYSFFHSGIITIFSEHFHCTFGGNVELLGFVGKSFSYSTTEIINLGYTIAKGLLKIVVGRYIKLCVLRSRANLQYVL
jgi:hypothetical protein